jgi:flagellar basal body rod protein FlgC
MDAFSISLAGLRASAAQFEASASNIVRASLPVAHDAAPSQSASSPPPPLSLSGLDFGTDLVGMTQALANYRANIAAINAENRIWKSTVDLIG